MDELVIMDDAKVIVGCEDVLDTLEKYEPAYKVAILERLLESCPYDYRMVSEKDIFGEEE